MGELELREPRYSLVTVLLPKYWTGNWNM